MRSGILKDSVVTLTTAATVYGKIFELPVKECAFQFNLAIGTAIDVGISIEVSCDGENFVDYEVGGTPVVEAMIATGTSIISIESPCIYMRPKYVVNSITGNATVACFINAKD